MGRWPESVLPGLVGLGLPGFVGLVGGSGLVELDSEDWYVPALAEFHPWVIAFSLSFFAGCEALALSDAIACMAAIDCCKLAPNFAITNPEKASASISLGGVLPLLLTT